MATSSVSDQNAPAVSGDRQRAVRLAAIVASIAALVLLLRYFSVIGHIVASKDWIAAQGAFGAVIFTLAYVGATVLVLPAFLLTLVGGGVYGFWKGLLLVSLASTTGATIAFLIARYVARDWIAKEIAMSPKFHAIDEGVAREGWKLVVLTRLSPIIPFNLQNYGYGLTSVPLWQYVLASWIGMMPGTVTYVYIGYATSGVVASRANDGMSVAQWTLMAVGLAATFVVTIVATRIAQRALARVTSTEAAPPA